MIPFSKIDEQWTLFLDRDGVINHEKLNDYIHTWDEFTFYEGVLEAFAIFAKKFERIIIITNQRGIGKRVTTLQNLVQIHTNMKQQIELHSGRVDAIYFCPDVDTNSVNRKPNTGMGLQAKAQFNEIDFSKTIMVGNTISDMQFGKNLGTYTVFLPTTRPDVALNDTRIDAVYQSLLAFAQAL